MIRNNGDQACVANARQSGILALRAAWCDGTTNKKSHFVQQLITNTTHFFVGYNTLFLLTS